jgi:hypothetical protein
LHEISRDKKLNGVEWFREKNSSEGQRLEGGMFSLNYSTPLSCLSYFEKFSPMSLKST